MSGRLDWPGMMRLGLGRLALPPEAFWAMTPVELLRAVEGRFGRPPEAMGRAALDAMMARHPDETRRGTEDDRGDG